MLKEKIASPRSPAGVEARTMVSVLTRVEDYLHSEIKRGMIKERRERGPTAPGQGVGTWGGGCAGWKWEEGARYANNGEIMYRLQ
ncbi:jg16695 [Pararge aegeria aegeria]|uniref:Jg16695 protein n=1 Tax=Pararge aegeria aegeria TaxID=348720 RepID=A0A8S4RMR6_9NEOP|nr:jg16695 [Pararge aegeria aegeria]